MNKHLCLSLILNIILILSITKKASEPSFCSRFKMHVLMVSMLAFAFKIRPIRTIVFSVVKKVSFHNQEIFPQWSKFSRKKFHLIKQIFHKQWSFLQLRQFSAKIFFDQINFLQTRKFTTKICFLDLKKFWQTKIFT